MHLYNIHTHAELSTKLDEYAITSILNTSPQSYEEEKGRCSSSQLFSCGVHPWHADEFNAYRDALKSIVKDNRVIAIGEVGLDKLKGGALELQIEVFRKQIELSEEVGKPLIIHCVRAWNELIGLRKQYNPHQNWIVHGFRGKLQLATQLLEAEIKLSIGERFDENTIKQLPVDSLFLETDESNMSICKVYGDVSRVLGFDCDKLSKYIERNVKNTFG